MATYDRDIMVKKVTVEEGCTMRTEEKAAQRLSRAVDEAFPSDSEQDRCRRHGCQPSIIGPVSPRSGYSTSQLFISLVEPDLNYLAIQLLNKQSNSLGDQWKAEVCRNAPAHRAKETGTFYIWFAGQPSRPECPHPCRTCHPPQGSSTKHPRTSQEISARRFCLHHHRNAKRSIQDKSHAHTLTSTLLTRTSITQARHARLPP